MNRKQRHRRSRRQRWTPDEDAKLRLMVEANMLTSRIAVVLGRSTRSIQSKLACMGLSPNRSPVLLHTIRGGGLFDYLRRERGK